MNNHEKQKAYEYFVKTYGENYTNHGHLMSFGYSTLPRLVRYSSRLSSDAKICYETLTDMIMNNDETIPWLYYPSQKRIALLSGLRRQQVNKAMRELQDANLVGSKRQGLGRQNVYCLLAPPQEFIEEALRCRAILNLIKREEMSWDDISDNNEVKEDGILEKIEAEKSMVTLDVSNNGHQEVFGKNAHQPNDGATESDNSQIHQEVFSENAVQGRPPLTAPAFSEKQELTSDKITSDEITSGPFVDFSKKKNHDTEGRVKFSTFRKRLKGDKLEAFELVADNLEKVIGKTLLEFVEQSPEAVKSAYEETVKRDKKHFSYFTKVFFSHLTKQSKRKSVGRELTKEEEEAVKKILEEEF